MACTARLKELLNNDRMQINMPINVSNLYTELDKIEGVQSVARLEINNLFDTREGYAGNQYNINGAIRNGILYPSLDPCIFEVKYPNKDIKGRIVSN